MNIRTGILAAAVFVFSLGTPPEAAPAEPSVPASVLGACDIGFFVTSTLHDFPGSARCQPFLVGIVRDASGKEVIPVLRVEVPVAGMSTRNGTRDGQMREMFQSDRYPSIRGTANDVDVERLRAEMGKGGEGKAPLDLVLRIREAERKIRAMASGLKTSGDRVTFDLEFPVSLGEFGLKPPTVFGIIRVGDKVAVKARFTLTVPGPPLGGLDLGIAARSPEMRMPRKHREYNYTWGVGVGGQRNASTDSREVRVWDSP